MGRPYRNCNDNGLVTLPTAATTRPSDQSLKVIAGLAKANLLMLPMMRVVENFLGRMPNTGDCLREVLKEIQSQPAC
jgi:hypothetical protein